jgi:hypothetical protein
MLVVYVLLHFVLGVVGRGEWQMFIAFALPTEERGTAKVEAAEDRSLVVPPRR